jgi:hypothetical protein
MVGQMFFATDATAGQNLFYCTAPGIWTVGSGAGSSNSGVCPLASGLGFALNGSDETALLNSVLTNMLTNGGGCLSIDAGKTLRADGQIALSNFANGASLRITGAVAAGGDGLHNPSSPPPSGGSVLDLRYHNSPYGQYGNGPKIWVGYSGNLEIDHVTLTTGGGSSDCAAFLMSTVTALYIHDTTFWGQKSASTWCNDALVLGGTSFQYDYTMTSAFAGYGSVIRDNRFLGMARVGHLQNYSNGSVFDSNYVQGGNSVTPVSEVFRLHGQARANVFSNNLIEFGNSAPSNTHMYSCAYRLYDSSHNIFRGNQYWDGDAAVSIFCGGDSLAINNVVDKSEFVDAPTTQLTDANWPVNNYMPYRTIPFFFDGGGSALSASTTRCGLISFGGQINQFTMAADQAGTARVTVKAVDLASYSGPNSAVDISNGGELLSGAVVKQDKTLTSWNKMLAPNAMVCFTLDNPANITWVGGALQVWEGR